MIPMRDQTSYCRNRTSTITMDLIIRNARCSAVATGTTDIGIADGRIAS